MDIESKELFKELLNELKVHNELLKKISNSLYVISGEEQRELMYNMENKYKNAITYI